jgi:RND superfamily putative drug exporter
VRGLAYDIHASRRAIVTAGVIAAMLAGAFGSSVFDEARPFGFQDPDSESSRAYDLLEEATGEMAVPGVVLLVEPGADVRKGGGREAVIAAAEELAAVEGIVRVSEPKRGDRLIATDGESALVLGSMDSSVEDPADVGGRVAGAFEDSETVLAGGAAVAAHQINEATEDDLRNIELFAAPFVFLISLLVFRGVVAALLPLLVGGISIALTLAALRLLTELMTIDVFALNVVTVLGLGLAIDYSLFMISRYRDELERHGPGREALWAALPPVARMVTFSSLTIAVAIASLLVFPQDFLASIGAGGALVALLSALVTIVFLPAVLTLLGERVNALSPAWLQRRRGASARWSAVARVVIRHPAAIAAVVAAAMLVAGIPFLRVELTRADARVLPEEASAHSVDHALQDRFEADPSASILVTVPERSSAGAAGDSRRLEGLDGVGEVGKPAPVGGGLVLIEAPLEVEASSQEAREVVQEARSLDWGAGVLVTGESAELVDQRSSLRDHLPLAVAIVIAGTLAAILLMTRSLLLPLLALLMNTLTVCATFGVLVLLFQDGRLESLLDFASVEALDSSVPILLFAVIFGLSTDYGVFLLNSISEARRRAGTETEAIAVGLERSGVVITGAALLFAIAMGAFVFSSLIFLKEVAVGTALAVLIDATLVRGLLFPALLKLCGPAAWWPGPRGERRLRP